MNALAKSGRSLTIYDFLFYINYVQNLGYTLKNGFLKCGIFSFNRNIFTNLNLMRNDITNFKNSETGEQ